MKLLWIVLLLLLLLSTMLPLSAASPETEATDLTQVYLPIIANDLPMSSISSPAPTATPVNPPTVN